MSNPGDPSRREFVRLAVALGASALGCGSPPDAGPVGSARLAARPHPPSGSVSPGTIALGLGSSRDGFLVVPAGYDGSRTWPLVLSLHGAGIDHTGPLNFLGPYAEGRGFLLLVVDSADYTWDAIIGGYGPDVAFIDRALSETFDRAAVDPGRIIVEGFSDGASYGLGLGRANGDLFTRVVAFSPGFIPASETPDHGKPPFFVSHGRQDPVLPIDTASRSIVTRLRAEGYDVTYLEYDGGHSVPPDVATAAVLWMLE